MKDYSKYLLVRYSKQLNESSAVTPEPTQLPQVSPGNAAGWDLAYDSKKQNADIEFAEPDIDNHYLFANPFTAGDALLESLSESGMGSYCGRNNGYEDAWPFPKQDGVADLSIWHLEEAYSQLKEAREMVGEHPAIIRIAHFDTGYDPSHFIYDDNMIRHDLERNFVEEELPRNAVDRYSQGLNPLDTPGHGTGTLSILAGKTVALPQYHFNDSIGLSSGIEIVPVRLAKSVVLFKNSSFVKALDYIISLYNDPSTRCHIVTMSMGGLPSKAWADLVNKAYEKGIFIVSAAGNNLGRATPRTLVYPARFNRVVAACGVMYDLTPYYKPFAIEHLKLMQGNFGPRKLMRTAVAAFTPNVSWAKIGCRDIISLSGAGTSSATPQVAAAAAIYYQTYYRELEEMPEGWMKVEAIRYALFTSAAQKAAIADSDIELYFGRGIIKAREMLRIAPDKNVLKKEAEDKISWPLFHLLFGSAEAMLIDLPIDEGLRGMYETEIAQLVQQSKALQDILADEEREMQDLNDDERRIFIETIVGLPQASGHLKVLLMRYAK